MRAHYLKMIKDSESMVRKFLPEQVLDPENEYFGGFRDPDGLIQAKFTIYRINTMMGLYCNEESSFYNSEQLEKSIFIALDFLHRVQNESGLFDYIDCNFNSAPDTAFCVKRLLPSWQWLESHKNEYSPADVKCVFYGKISDIISKAADGMAVRGGFHTPNHRWAIASILMECGKCFDRPEWGKAARAYLNEGIDCNEDGEYAEKSAGNYNRINNDAMITIGDCTGDQAYYGHAIRNLRMMLTYIEPDGSIFTANSTRQDNGCRIYPVDYYTEYLRMGHDFDIPEFLDMANRIFQIIDEKKLEAPDYLMWMMNNQKLIDVEHEGSYVQPDFACFYKDSGISRTHSGAITWTLLQGKSNFLYFTNGSMVIEMKLAGSFCEHRAFVPEKMEPNDALKSSCYGKASGKGRPGCLLSQTMHGWYYLPFDEKPDTTDWWKMDNASRKKLHGPDINFEVSVEEVSDEDGLGLDVRIKTGGVKSAPFRVELACSGAERVFSDAFEVPASPGSAVIVKSGFVSFADSCSEIKVGPAFAEHRFTNGKFGSEKKSVTCVTVYFTDFIPFERLIKIRNIR
ncbi:MAG: hypothetical protein K5930_11540 [Treponemataceae bacterium]|nr:hypothetical protein [Treponemataceae bacterium]